MPKVVDQFPPNLRLDSYEFVANDEFIKNKHFLKSLTDIVSENTNKNNLIVTEINMSSKFLIDHVKSYMADFKSWLTNIEYNLVVKKVDKSNDSLCKNIIVWNSTKEQLSVTRSDLVILNDSQELHDANCETLFTDLYDSVKEKGFLLIVYRYEETELQLIPGFSSKQYLNVESRVENVLEVCQRLGLTFICHKYDSIGTIALLFRENAETFVSLEDNQIIEITNDRNYVWFEKLKHKFIFNNNYDENSNIWLIARDSHINGILGLINCLRLEPGGECVRCIVDYDNNIELPIDWNSKQFNDILSKDLVINVLKDGKLGTYRHLNLPEDYDKTESNEYFLELGQTKDLSSIQWFDGRSVSPNEDDLDIHGTKLSMVNVLLYCTGFNLCDVQGIKPLSVMKTRDYWIGCEFAGRRADTNQRVMGFGVNSFSTSINVTENMITSIPEHWSMDEGVTILINYFTVWYSLIEKACLKRGESVLIHSATDGVCQSAINVCKHFECDIYVIVESEEEKAFLIKEFNIPENRIFNSRFNQIRHSIIEMTNGEGINISLNSTVDSSIKAGYECLVEHGRLVQFGENKNLEMAGLRKDITIIMIDVYLSLMSSTELKNKFFDWMNKNSSNGCVKPLNKIVFNANEAEKAFKLWTTGKHIGKIVIRIRDEETDKGPEKLLPALKMSVSKKTHFNPNKVHIITGGLGGLGLELIQWMISLGAKKFVLTSRSGFKDEYQKFIINRLTHFGEQKNKFEVNIQISQNDCMTIESTRIVISQAMDLGEIGGVFHLTLVLNDSLLEDMEFEKFCETIETKYKVFNNMDLEFRRLNYNLELFVVFSSTTSGKGRPGQTNYGISNALCERICEQRRKDGLHGMAIQFGAIGDVGALAKIRESKSLIDYEDQSISSCSDILGRLLSVNHPIVTSYLISSKKDESLDEENDTIFQEFWKLMGVDPNKTPDHLALGDIGLDSMLALKLHQELYYAYQINVSLEQIKIISIRMMREFESGNQQYLRQFVQDYKNFQQTVTKYEYKWAAENYVQLNNRNVMEGKPIYFLAPFEITFSVYKQLAESMGRPVIGINLNKNMNNFESFKDIINYYSEILQKLSPNGEYDLLGSFDGVFVILDLLNKGLVNNAVAIDVLTNHPSIEEVKSDVYLFDILLSFVSSDCPDFYKEKLAQIANNEQKIKPRIQIFAQGVKDIVGRQLVATDMEEIFQCAVKRIKLMTVYRAQSEAKPKKISSKFLTKQTMARLSIIKPISLNNEKDLIKVNEDVRQKILA